VATYDGFGNEVGRAYYGVDGKPVILKGSGYARVAWKYRGVGQATDEAFYDEHDKPVAGPSGWSMMRSDFDAQGRERARSYLDEAGKPWATKSGWVAGWVRYDMEYDARGRESQAHLWDKDDKPLAECATMKWLYDDTQSKRTVTVCLDPSGKETKRQ
jgi:hypothetical protein